MLGSIIALCQRAPGVLALKFIFKPFSLVAKRTSARCILTAVSCLLLAFAITVMFLSSAHAQTSNQPVENLPRLSLHPGEDATSIARHLRYTNIEDVELSIGDIKTKDTELKSLPTDVIQFGPAKDAIYVRLNVENIADTDGSWILFTGRGSLTGIRIWRLDGTPSLLFDGTNKADLISNLRTYQAFSAEIGLAAGEEADIAILFSSADTTYLPLKLQTFRHYFSDRRANIAMVSAVVCGTLVLIFLNLFFFRITGQSEFFWLALAEIALAFNTVHAEGYTTIFAFATHPILGMAFGDIVKCAFAAFMAQFARTFVSTEQELPRIDLCLRIIIFAALTNILVQMGASIWSESVRNYLFYSAWLIVVLSALFLPYVAIVATRQLGREYWPLILAWGSLALYIFYTAIASSGVISGLPVLWHLAGPVGLFEAFMATIALGLHIRAIQVEKSALGIKLNNSLIERLAISERTVKLERERASALASLTDQNSLLHASGHDMRQVVSVIQSSAKALKRGYIGENFEELPELLLASAGYLEDIAATSMSASVPEGSSADIVALSGTKIDELLKPIERIYRQVCREEKLDFFVHPQPEIFIVTDRALVLRTLSNLLSNAVKFSNPGGRIDLSVEMESHHVIIEIMDRGRGVSDAIAKRLNSDVALGVRENDDVAGTGWGFAQSRTMINRLDGSLEISGRNEGGCCVRIKLPLATEELSFCSSIALQDKFQEAGLDIGLFDGDSEEDFSHERNVIIPRIYTIYDDTAKGRARIAKLDAASTILIKPLCLEMSKHPCLTAYQKIKTA